jgi:phosphatidylserine/phosphatidylglycerophosphate/cardiolipin synthase-like enzyme
VGEEDGAKTPKSTPKINIKFRPHPRQAVEKAESAEDKKKAEEQLSIASEQLSRVKTQLDTIPVRGLDVYEHPELLERALTQTRERLLIISPWIKAKVVNRAFVSKLERLLARNVKVYIGYGLGEDDEQSRDNDRRAEQDLERMAQKYANFTFVRLGDTHAKVLISDRNFIVTTSFNWLSFKGDPNRTFRDEQGTFVAIPDFVDQRFEHLVSRFAPGS